nr:ryncolin-1-like [Cherax quadricarinatus]
MQEENMWTVFLARYRQITQVSFSKGWEDYKTGFGDPHGEYWLGNDNLHALTSGGRRYQLKVIATNLRGEQLSAVWETFSVADEANEYRVTMGGYTSTSTLNDALTSEHDWANLNGSSFTTVDSDHDTWSGASNTVLRNGDYGSFNTLFEELVTTGSFNTVLRNGDYWQLQHRVEELVILAASTPC